MTILHPSQVLCKVITGSRLYGLETPKSDYDFKSVYLPDIQELILHRDQDNIQLHDKEHKVDYEAFSLQRFIELLIQGQAIALEMLSASPVQYVSSDGCMVTATSPAWYRLSSNRHRFYSKKMQAFLGYARAQSSKYSTRSERMITVSNVLNFLKANDPKLRLRDIWELLPAYEGVEKTTNSRNKNADTRVYSIAGRELHCTVTIEHAISVVENIYNSYGERVKAAVHHDAHDMKSLSHAFRVAYQVKQIATIGELKFPLPERDFIFAVKTGKMKFVEGSLGEKLDDLIHEVEELIASPSCNLPDYPDADWANDFIIDQYAGQIIS